jgi:hypothetical protein
MSFWYSGPVTDSGGTTPVSVNIELHDDLSAQVDGVKDTFTVTRGSYESGSLDISVGGVSGMSLGTHYFETSPSSGIFKTVRALTADDLPLIAQYKY